MFHFASCTVISCLVGHVTNSFGRNDQVLFSYLSSVETDVFVHISHSLLFAKTNELNHGTKSHVLFSPLFELVANNNFVKRQLGRLLVFLFLFSRKIRHNEAVEEKPSSRRTTVWLFLVQTREEKVSCECHPFSRSQAS